MKKFLAPLLTGILAFTAGWWCRDVFRPGDDAARSTPTAPSRAAEAPRPAPAVSAKAPETDEKILSDAARVFAAGDPAAMTTALGMFPRLRGQDSRLRLIALLGEARGDGSPPVLHGLYMSAGALPPADARACRSAILSALARHGGGLSLTALLALLKTEKDVDLIGKIGSAIAVTAHEPDVPTLRAALAETGPPDARHALEDAIGKVQAKEANQAAALEVEKLDPSTPEGVEGLSRVLASDATLGIRLQALGRLERSVRPDAVTAIADLTRREAKTPEDRVLRSTALAALCRSRSNEARVAVQNLVDTSDDSMKQEIVGQIGAFGDQPYNPLLERLEMAATSEALKRAAKEARRAIEDRAKK